MKKEQLAEQYAEGKSSSSVFKEAHKRDFLAGFEAGQPKWISVEEQTPPDDDREVLVYVRDLITPHWSGNKLGAYIDGKWYLQGGIEQQTQLVRWLDIPTYQELKTSEQWSEVFKNVTVLDPDAWDRKNFKYSWFEEEIEEREYINRLSRSTTSV